MTSMRGMFKECELPTGFPLGDNFDTSSVTDMAGMFQGCALPVGFTLGKKFIFKTVISVHKMFFGAHIPEGFSLNDFDFNANRDYVSMLTGCEFPDDLSIGGLTGEQFKKIISTFSDDQSHKEEVRRWNQ